MIDILFQAIIPKCINDIYCAVALRMKLMELKRCIDLKWVNFCIFFQNDHVTGW